MTPAERARDRMVSALRAAGRLRDPAIEEAFRAVPRHEFLPDLPIGQAYADEAVAVQRIGGVATSSASQPSMMAIMLEQLAARPGDRVLEIGAGTGYNAALLARIVGATGSVTAVDIDAELIESAARHLAAAGATGVRLVCADGALGYPPDAPYDRIVLTVGSSDVRSEWVAQLAPGGRMLLPLALRGSQLSVALDLGPDGLLRSDSVRGCAFIRLRGVGAAPDSVVPVGAGCSMQVPGGRCDRAGPGGGGGGAGRAGPGPTGRRGAGAAGRVGRVRVVAGPARPALGPAAASTTTWSPATTTRRGSGRNRRPRSFPIGVGYAGVALVGPGPGVALAGPVRGGHRWPRAAGVHAFGPGGAVPAGRLAAALAAWDAAGRPRAAGLRLVVAPRPVLVEPRPGAVIPLPNGDRPSPRDRCTDSVDCATIRVILYGRRASWT